MILLSSVQGSIAAIIVLTMCIPFFFFSYTTRSLSYSNLVFRVLPSFLSVVVGIIFAFVSLRLLLFAFLFHAPALLSALYSKCSFE